MSRTYDIVCHDCKLSLWIGQRHSGEDRAYLYGTNEERAKQERFLFGHMGHRLEVMDSEYTGLDYEEAFPDPEDTPHG